MSQQLEHSWVKEIFSQEELNEYVKLETKIKSENSKPEFEKNWNDLVEKLNQHLQYDPHSAEGIAIGEEFMQWVNSLYGKEYAHLRTRKFEKGFGEGLGLDDVGLNKESVAWLEQAMDTYWRQRIYRLLEQVGSICEDDLLKLWNTLMDDMYGNEDARKGQVIEIALADDKVSKQAKTWLKQLQEQ